MFDDEIGEFGGPTCLCCGGGLQVLHRFGWTLRACTACGLETVAESGALPGRLARALAPRRSSAAARNEGLGLRLAQ